MMNMRTTPNYFRCKLDGRVVHHQQWINFDYYTRLKYVGISDEEAWQYMKSKLPTERPLLEEKNPVLFTVDEKPLKDIKYHMPAKTKLRSKLVSAFLN